jgi:DNA-binding GntR family transcriptional regulator
MVKRVDSWEGSEKPKALKVYARMRNFVLTGEWKPGERLVERRLAQSFGVSRTPIRQDIAMLEVEGLIRTSPNHGAV